MRAWSLVAMVCASTAMSGMVAAQPRVRNGALTDTKGMTLYVWDNDVAGSGKSVCYGACTLTMTPFPAEGNAKESGDFGFIVRDDGKRQWTYKGRPLYVYVNDKRPGDRAGDGFRAGTWHYAKQ
jgi:predicted lipoprotein with Yx(FWY)xxD motif